MGPPPQMPLIQMLEQHELPGPQAVPLGKHTGGGGGAMPMQELQEPAKHVATAFVVWSIV